MKIRLPAELYLVTYTDAAPGYATSEERIDLLPYLDDWTPGAPPLKDGGQFVSGSYLDGRRLVMAPFGNVIEAFNLKPNRRSPEDLVDLLRRIRYFLRRGRAYHTSQWQDKPVWIQARSRREANRRYAVLANGNAPQDDNPYLTPFDADSLPSISEWPLELERGHWLSNKPGESTPTACYATMLDSGTSFGNAAPGGTLLPNSTGGVYVSNKHTLYNISHIFTFDASTGLFSANLVGGAVPVYLLPAAVGVGDCVYFIRQQIGGRDFPFDNLVFNLLEANGTGGVWEYFRNAVGWTPLPNLMDNTAFLTALGINSLHYLIPAVGADWVATAVNGVTGLGLRYRVTAVGTGARPRQQLQNVYTTTWNFTNVAESEVGGDLPATLRMRLANVSEKSGGGANYLHAHRVIVGLRSLVRGAEFTSHIGLTGDGAANVSTTLGVHAAFTTDIYSPYGRRVTFNPVGAGTETVMSVDLLDRDAYKGRFRVFLWGQQAGGAAGDILLRLDLTTGNPLSDPDWISEFVQFSNVQPYQVLDFGEITLQAGDYDTEASYLNRLAITAQVASAVPDIYLYSLVLIPVDEWSGEFVSINSDVASSLGRDSVYGQRFLEIDSVIDLKRPIRAVNRLNNAPYHRWSSWESIAAGPAILQVGQDQRLFYLFLRKATPADPTDERAEPEFAASVSLVRTQRYETFRGDS